MTNQYVTDHQQAAIPSPAHIRTRLGHWVKPLEKKLQEGPTETQILNTYPNKGMMVIMVPGSVLPLRIVFLLLPQKQLEM